MLTTLVIVLGLLTVARALAADTPLPMLHGEIVDLPVTASATIYEGAAVGVDPATGYAKALVSTNDFAGIAMQRAVGTTTAGETRVKVRWGLFRSKVLVTGASAVTDAGKPVYASADNTFTLTASTNVAVGRVVEWISGTTCIVEFRTSPAAVAAIAALSATTGTAEDGGARTAINSILVALRAVGIVRTA